MFTSNLLGMIIVSCSLIGFLYVHPNLLYWLLVAELLWVGLYSWLTLNSMLFDTLDTFIFGLLIFCLATSESAVGLTLIIFNFLLTGNIHGATMASSWIWTDNSLATKDCA